MKIQPKLEQKQVQQEQPEIQDKIRVRSLEVVNNEDQVIAVIGEENEKTEKRGKAKKIATFFDDAGKEIAHLGVSASGSGFVKFLGNQESIFISGSGFLYIKSDAEDESVSAVTMNKFVGGFYVWVEDKQDNTIKLEIDMKDGKVTIDSTYTDESEQKEIKTSKTIFKSAE